MQASQYATTGDSSVLRVCEVDRPAPKPGCAVVRVVAASLNPIDFKVECEGEMRCGW
jgi:NADPH:quinone reductase-like Zn-dependent oxidoreductase